MSNTIRGVDKTLSVLEVLTNITVRINTGI